ncbi:hypothetical protein LCGC14_2696450 [marine sediment metagenome]|uniref:Uncharacterized protein n=1 Tax=marine sediment metagenome TaxID=412755 RepID=A0A0F8ZH56_9ZZZZ
MDPNTHIERITRIADALAIGDSGEALSIDLAISVDLSRNSVLADILAAPTDKE